MLKFKTYVWPQEPHTYQDELTRTPHYRVEEGDSYYEGMSPVQRKITGTGAFYGQSAFASYQGLVDIFRDFGPGELVHSTWGTCFCHFTNLELTQEPKEGYIRYRFEFTGALPGGEIPR